MTASAMEFRGWRDYQKGKRTHGHGQQCGGCWGKGGRRGLNGSREKTQ